MKSLRHLLKPHRSIERVEHLTESYLERHHINYLVFDVDDTLVHGRSNELGHGVIAAIRRLSQSPQVQGIYLASNSRRDLTAIGEALGAQIITASWISRKPWPHHFRRIVATIGSRPRHIAIVGDKHHTDILGGNLAGLHTIRVTPRRHLAS